MRRKRPVPGRDPRGGAIRFPAAGVAEHRRPESPVEKPTLPGAKNDAAGTKAFAEYVVRAWEYALATNDFSAMDAADPAYACEPCEVMRDASKERATEESYIDGTVEETNRTSSRFYFEVTMKFEGDHFQMTRFQVG